MAITRDTSGDVHASASASATVSLTAAQANEVAVILTWNGNGADLSSVTVGGSAATKVSSSNVFGTQWMGMYLFLNPPTSATNYVANATNATDDLEIAVILLKGGKQSTTPDSSNIGSATGNLTLSTTVVAPNSWVVGFARNQSAGKPTGSTGFTTLGGTSLNFGDSNATVSSGSYSMSWTAGSATTAGKMLSIAPAPLVVANSNFLAFM